MGKIREFYSAIMAFAFIALILCIVLITILVFTGFTDATEECKPLESSSACGYEKCMYKNYNSDTQFTKLQKCLYNQTTHFNGDKN